MQSDRISFISSFVDEINSDIVDICINNINKSKLFAHKFMKCVVVIDFSPDNPSAIIRIFTEEAHLNGQSIPWKQFDSDIAWELKIIKIWNKNETFLTISTIRLNLSFYVRIVQKSSLLHTYFELNFRVLIGSLYESCT